MHRVRVILLATLSFALAACDHPTTASGGSDGGTEAPDSGGSGCTPACTSPLVCNAATGQCGCPSGSPPCGTTCCAANLACSNGTCTNPGPDSGPSSDAGPPGLGTPCNPDLTRTPQDPCAAFSLECDFVFLNLLPDGGSTCQLGSEGYSPCDVSIGCLPPLQCEIFVGPQGGNLGVCVQPCASVDDCPNPLEGCRPFQGHPVCITVPCGPGSSPPNGTNFYGRCNNQSTNDGICLPIQPSTFNGPEQGYCVTGGTAALSEPCGLRLGDGGTSQICVAGSACLSFQFIDTQGVPRESSLCAPLCAPPGSGASGARCPTTDTWSCMPSSPPNSPGYSDFGYCVQACDANGTVNDAGAMCPPPLMCLPVQFSASTSTACVPD